MKFLKHDFQNKILGTRFHNKNFETHELAFEMRFLNKHFGTSFSK